MHKWGEPEMAVVLNVLTSNALDVLRYEMEKMTQEEQAVALWLFDHGAVKIGNEGRFTQKEHQFNPAHPLTHIYFHLRATDHPREPGVLTPEIYAKIGDVLVTLIVRENVAFNAVAGIPEAGVLFAKAFAKSWKERFHKTIPLLPLLKTQEGSVRFISGVGENPDVKKGSRILLFDDVIAQGRSKEEAVTVLRTNRYFCDDIGVLVDRREGGVQKLDQMGVTVHAANTVHQYTGLYLFHKKIAFAQAEAVLSEISL